jgi:hypothetical protein
MEIEQRSYEIHDNGGRPFRVDIQGKDVAVWKNMNTFRFMMASILRLHIRQNRFYR